MGQSFKLKLEKLTDEEFSELLVNRDMFTGRKLSLIDQEARNRYFSNKDFNGENDAYYNPDILSDQSQIALNLRKVAIVAGGVAFVVLMFFIVSSLIKQKSEPVLFTENQEITQIDHSDPMAKEELKAPENKMSSDQNLTTNGVQSLPNNDQPQASGVVRISEPDKMLSESTEKPVNHENSQAVKNIETTQQVSQNPPVQIAENKNGKNQGVRGGETVRNTQTANSNQQKEPADIKNKPEPEKKSENQKVTVTEEPDTEMNEKSRTSKISNLSTEQLRQLVKFQNEWAFKQTTAKGVIDYYVDGNTAIKFILNQAYSDSVNTFQTRFVPNLTTKYWSDLEIELGKQFPKTSIQIQFVRFDAKF